jgi:hypothetical protein
MKWLLVLSLSFILKIAQCQTICFEIDSVLVYYIPWDAHSKFSLNEDDFKCINNKKLVFTDSMAIKELLTSFLRKEVFLKKEFSVDIRMLIEIYFNNKYIKIGIENSGFYVYSNTLYKRNKELIKWINKYITEME